VEGTEGMSYFMLLLLGIQFYMVQALCYVISTFLQRWIHFPFKLSEVKLRYSFRGTGLIYIHPSLFRNLKRAKRWQTWTSANPVISTLQFSEPLSRLFNVCREKHLFRFLNGLHAFVLCDLLQNWASCHNFLQICFKIRVKLQFIPMTLGWGLVS